MFGMINLSESLQLNVFVAYKFLSYAMTYALVYVVFGKNITVLQYTVHTWSVILEPFPIYFPMHYFALWASCRCNHIQGNQNLDENDWQTWGLSSRSRFNTCDVDWLHYELLLGKLMDQPCTSSHIFCSKATSIQQSSAISDDSGFD